jgi:hypothetical protein
MGTAFYARACQSLCARHLSTRLTSDDQRKVRPEVPPLPLPVPLGEEVSIRKAALPSPRCRYSSKLVPWRHLPK